MCKIPIIYFVKGGLFIIGLISPIFGQEFYLGARNLYSWEQSEVSGNFWLSNRNAVAVSNIAFHLNIETPDIFLVSFGTGPSLENWTVTLDSLGNNTFAIELSGTPDLSQPWAEILYFNFNWNNFPSGENPSYYASNISINDSIQIPNSFKSTVSPQAPPGFLEAGDYKILGDVNEDSMITISDVNEALTSFKNSSVNQNLLDISTTPGVDLYDIGLQLKHVLGMNPELIQNTQRVESGAVVKLSEPVQLGTTNNFLYNINAVSFSKGLSLYLQLSVDTSIVEQITISGFSPKAAVINGWDQSNRLNIYNLAILMPFEDTKEDEDVISLLATHKSGKINTGLEIISANVNETTGYLRGNTEVIWKEGCTDSTHINYDFEAIWENGNCDSLTSLTDGSQNLLFKEIGNGKGLTGMQAGGSPLHIQLFNLVGQIQLQKQLSPFKILFFDKIPFKKGIYLLKVDGEGKSQIFKIYLP